MNGPVSLLWWGFAFVQRGLTFWELTKTPLIYTISYFNLGANRTKAPMATRMGPEELNDEATLEIAHEICDWNG